MSTFQRNTSSSQFQKARSFWHSDASADDPKVKARSTLSKSLSRSTPNLFNSALSLKSRFEEKEKLEKTPQKKKEVSPVELRNTRRNRFDFELKNIDKHNKSGVSVTNGKETSIRQEIPGGRSDKLNGTSVSSTSIGLNEVKTGSNEVRRRRRPSPEKEILSSQYSKQEFTIDLGNGPELEKSLEVKSEINKPETDSRLRNRQTDQKKSRTKDFIADAEINRNPAKSETSVEPKFIETHSTEKEVFVINPQSTEEDSHRVRRRQGENTVDKVKRESKEKKIKRTSLHLELRGPSPQKNAENVNGEIKVDVSCRGIERIHNSDIKFKPTKIEKTDLGQTEEIKSNLIKVASPVKEPINAAPKPEKEQKNLVNDDQNFQRASSVSKDFKDREISKNETNTNTIAKVEDNEPSWKKTSRNISLNSNLSRLTNRWKSEESLAKDKFPFELRRTNKSNDIPAVGGGKTGSNRFNVELKSTRRDSNNKPEIDSPKKDSKKFPIELKSARREPVINGREAANKETEKAFPVELRRTRRHSKENIVADKSHRPPVFPVELKSVTKSVAGLRGKFSSKDKGVDQEVNLPPKIKEPLTPVNRLQVAPKSVAPVIEAEVVPKSVAPVIEAEVLTQSVNPVIKAEVVPKSVAPVIEAKVVPKSVAPVIEAELAPKSVTPENRWRVAQKSEAHQNRVQDLSKSKVAENWNQDSPKGAKKDLLTKKNSEDDDVKIRNARLNDEVKESTVNEEKINPMSKPVEPHVAPKYQNIRKPDSGVIDLNRPTRLVGLAALRRRVQQPDDFDDKPWSNNLPEKVDDIVKPKVKEETEQPRKLVSEDTKDIKNHPKEVYNPVEDKTKQIEDKPKEIEDHLEDLEDNLGEDLSLSEDKTTDELRSETTDGDREETTSDEDNNLLLTDSEDPKMDLIKDYSKRDEKPLILRKLRDKTCTEGDSIKFVCDLKGDPKPEVTWYKDGEVIKDSREKRIVWDGKRARLEISNACVQDEGEYTCKASSSAGEASTSAALMVEELDDPESDGPETPPPEEAEKIQPEEDKVATKEEIQSIPESRSRRSPDGIQNGNGLHNGGYKSELVATDDSLEDTMSSLSAGSRSSRRYVREAKPTFIIKPRRQFVDEGATAKFKASFDGEPPPTLTWDINGTAITNSDKYTVYDKNDFYFLEVNDVTEADKGRYKCTITNSLGSDTAGADLEVYAKLTTTRVRKSAPKVERELVDKTVDDGESLSLTCTITGTPEPTVAWKHDGKPVKTSQDIKESYNGRTAKLAFTEAYPEDEGTYQCTASNLMGEAHTSCVLKVKVAKPVAVAPAFTTHLSDLSINDGDKNIRLVCVVTGKPEPKVTWYKANKEIKHSEDFKTSYNAGEAMLNITEVYPEDDGEYSCVAENEAGEATTKGKLTVKVPQKEEPLPAKKVPPPQVKPKPPSSNRKSITEGPPGFVRHLQNLTASDGDRVELEVQVQGAEPMEVIWLHGDKEIKDSNKAYTRQREGDVHKLIIGEVFPEDGGLYVCELYNELGDEDCTCTLTVKDGSKNSKNLLNKQNEANNNVDHHNEEDMADGEEEEDEEDEDGEDFYPPEFLRKPKSVHIDEGSSAKFTCHIGGNLPINVRWEKDGNILADGGRFRVSEEGEVFVFEIPHTLATDAGRYVVIATNRDGKEKCSVSLMVKELESTEVTDFRGLLKTSPHLTSISLQKSLPPENKFVLPHRPQLKTIGASVAESSSESEKDCEQHDFRSVLKRHVRTKQRPKVEEELADAKAREGDMVVLQCVISGVPKPDLKWFLAKKEIKESKYFKMTYENSVAKLTMAEVYPEDEGEYTCRASNEAGNVTTKCDVYVQELDPDREEMSPRDRGNTSSDAMEPPLIEDLTPDNIHVLRGHKFQLKAKFAGEPTPNVRWMLGKTELTPGRHEDGRVRVDVVRDTSTLTVTDAIPEDSGCYSLTVQNELGHDTCSSSVTVEDRPNSPAGVPAASNITGNGLTLSWYGPSYDGGSHVTEYRVEVCKQPDLEWKTLTSACKYTSYTVKNLERNSAYKFRVSAGNKHGFSEPSKETDPIVTIDRRRSSAKLDELPFEPRNVTIDTDRKLEDVYDLREEIGKGRFGNVYKCIEKESRRELAVKFIKTKISEREGAYMEIAVMNELQHPKLLMLYDAFETVKHVLLVMEHVAGGELFERIIDDDYVLTERECVHFMRQICDGVQFMHDSNILHLDLKPENILCITHNSNEIKIIDFGLARKLDPGKNPKVLFGTPEFVAPEVVNYDDISYPTDMWSVGVICYILMSGLSPFMGNNEAETLVNVTMSQWDFEDETFDEISDSAKEFIEGLLVKNMRKRMTADQCLAHAWLSQDVKYMRAKRLSTVKHKRFIARRKWQKTGNAIRALGRMASLQRQLSGHHIMRGQNGDPEGQRCTASDSGIEQKTTTTTSMRVRRSRSSEARMINENDSGIESEAKSGDVEVLEEGGSTSPPPPTSLPPAVPQTSSPPPSAPASLPPPSTPASPPPPIMPKPPSPRRTSFTATASVNLTDSLPPGGEKDNNDNVKETTSRDEKQEAPYFIRKMRNFEVFEGDSARFDVKVKGHPEPEVTWFKDNIEIEESRHYVMDYDDEGLCILIIKHCGEEDDAAYSCTAVNTAGKVTCSADLYVEGTGE